MRRTLAALLGALASVGILVGLSYAAFIVLTALVIVPLMIWIAFGRLKCRNMIRLVMISWLSIIILNGITSVFYQWTGMQSLTIYGGILVLLVAGVLVRILLGSIRRQEQRVQVQLSHQGYSVSCMGLYDSGNRLQMPGTGEPVHIISGMLLEKLQLQPMPTQKIPFCALGTENGSISVVKLDELCVTAAGKEYSCRGAWMGCADENLLKNTEYQVILNASVRLE